MNFRSWRRLGTNVNAHHSLHFHYVLQIEFFTSNCIFPPLAWDLIRRYTEYRTRGEPQVHPPFICIQEISFIHQNNVNISFLNDRFPIMFIFPLAAPVSIEMRRTVNAGLPSLCGMSFCLWLSAFTDVFYMSNDKFDSN